MASDVWSDLPDLSVEGAATANTPEQSPPDPTWDNLPDLTVTAEGKGDVPDGTVARERQAELEKVWSPIDSSIYRTAAWASPFAYEVAGGIEGLKRGFEDPWNFGQRFGEGYSDMQKMAEQNYDDAGVANPKAAMAGNVAGLVGGIIGGGTEGLAIKGLTKVAPRVAAKWAGSRLFGNNVLNTGIRGGMFQGAYWGAGEDGGIEDRLKGTAVGAGVGAGVGAIPGVTGFVYRNAAKPAMEYALERGANAVGGITNPTKRAHELVGKALNADAANAAAHNVEMLSPNDIPAAVARGQDTVIADLGGEVTGRLARAASNASPEAGARLKAVAGDRFGSQTGRVVDHVDNMYGGLNSADISDELQKASEAAVRPLYQRAMSDPRGQTLFTSELDNLLQSPAVQKAIDEAEARSAEMAVSQGTRPIKNPFARDANGNLILNNMETRATPSLAFWDVVKRGLDDQVNALYRAGETGKAKFVKGTRDRLRNHLDDLVPTYKQARGAAAEFFRANDAFEAGQKFASQSREADVSNSIAFINKLRADPARAAEAELFERGFMSAYTGKLSATRDGRDISKILMASEMDRAKFSAAVPAVRRREIEAMAKVERIMQRLNQHVSGGSNTTQQLLDLGIGAGAGYWANGDLTGAAVGATLLRGGHHLIDRRLMGEVSKLLASGNPHDIAAVSQMAARNPSVMRLIERIGDKVGAFTESTLAPAAGATAGVMTTDAAAANHREEFAAGGRVPFDKGGLARKALGVIDDWLWRSGDEVAGELGLTGKAMPQHVQEFGHFMKDMSDKAGSTGLSDRDLMKAYTITRASIQRGAVDADKLRSNGFDIPGATGPIRPEGAFSEWLLSPMGKRYLDNLERGVVDEEAILDAQKKMAPFGKHETDLPDFMRNAVKLSGQAEATSDLVSRAAIGKSDPQEWRDYTASLRGIGPSKKGFYASLLGRGDQPTLDARQVILHTGRPTKEASKYIARRGGKGGEAAVDRLAERQASMEMQVAPELEPYYQHLAHHTVWDTVANERTTHEDIIRAMRLAAMAGALPAGVAAMGEENLLSSMGGSEKHADGGRVGFSKGNLVKATFAQMMKLAGITDERDMKAIAQAYGNATKMHPKEWEYEYRDLGNIHRPEGVFDPEQAVKDNAVMLQLYGDRSPAGRDLVSINGKKLSKPVHQQGGNEFIYGPNGRAADPAVWASLPGAVSTLLGRARGAAAEGPVYGVYSAMGPKGIDFSTMPLKSALGQAAVRNDAEALRSFDQHMLGKLDGNDGYPGIATAPGRKAMLSNIEGMGGLRAAMIKELDTDPFRELGLPDMGPIRWANTDPALVDVSTGATGRSIARLDPTGRRVIGMPDPHDTYQHGVGGTPTAGYDMSVPAGIWFSDYFRPRLKALGIDNLGEVGLPGTELYAMSRSDVTQRATQEWLDTLMNYRRAVEEGKINPPTGPRAKPLKGRN